MSGWIEVLAAKERMTHERASRRHQRQGDAARSVMYLASVRMLVPGDLDLLSPDMRVAVVEDLLWSIEALRWVDRKPRAWHRRARAQWRDEGNALADKLDRIRHLAGR
ncbi:hypothetical protein LWC34_17745 [Kibdelosporangium philippinense]|uniref:Uncharacterized protein n=2 Tax=Kibdelosporangium philippinense TaxID=211113 RepID=A0ABS8Z9Y1_9PSEU|nr:hypothetical protein [Kibdelosporangium philippinense]MCE7004654.1 hypothetical protein [Kibdelosporangium philippinense]